MIWQKEIHKRISFCLLLACGHHHRFFGGIIFVLLRKVCRFCAISYDRIIVSIVCRTYAVNERMHEKP